MYKDHTIAAVIPARKGSKRLPKKNIRDFCGRPLIALTIEEAIKSEYIDTVIVTSDDPEVLRIASKYNIVSISRPKNLSDDNSKSKDVVKHALNEAKLKFESFILLQPTSPLRTVNDIDEAIEELYLKSADSIVSVSECEHNPLWSNTLPENNSMKHFIKEGNENIRSQYLEKHYRLNGAIYAVNTSFFKSSQNFFGDNTFAYHMPAEKSIDIDTLSDFICAEAIMTYNISKKK